MPGLIPLGSVRGIPIRAHWSVLLIAGLIAWGLAGQALPSQVPGLEPALYWAAGSIAALAVLASLLAHELAHALVARREGHTVDDISLWLLGGVARIAGDARTPGAEARIAGVGPLASLVLGGVFGLVAVGLGLVPGGSLVRLVQAAIGWLALVNVVLAVFNLLPGAPLDGGRIARAAIWRWRGDKLRATRWASGLGQLLGYGLVAFGIAGLLAGDGLGGVWSVVLGTFLASAAGHERRQAELTDSLGDLRVAAVMTPDPPRVPASLTVDTFVAAALAEARTSTWLLTGPGGEVSGLLGIDRLRRLRGPARMTTRLGAVAVPIDEAPTASPDERVVDLLARLDSAHGPRAVVREGGSIVGIVSPEGIARAVRVTHPRDGQGGAMRPSGRPGTSQDVLRP